MMGTDENGDGDDDGNGDDDLCNFDADEINDDDVLCM